MIAGFGTNGSVTVPPKLYLTLRAVSYRPRKADEVLVMGQILNADKPDQRVKDFRVLLLRGKRITAQTNSSPLGEFRFELADAKNWKLLFEVEGQEVIPISLPELT